MIITVVRGILTFLLTLGLVSCGERGSSESVLTAAAKLVLQESRPVLKHFRSEAPCYAKELFDFSKKVKLSDDPPAFGDIRYSAMDRVIAKSMGRVFTNVSPADLPFGKSYNYVITVDGDWIFGAVEDSWEIGVKHVVLANYECILAAGEFRTEENGDYRYNLFSGSITRFLLQNHKEYRAELKQIVTDLFLSAMGERRGRYSSGTLHPENAPEPAEKSRICSLKDFKRRNPEVCRAVEPDPFR